MGVADQEICSEDRESFILKIPVKKEYIDNRHGYKQQKLL